MERHSFHIVSSDYPETMRKLCLFTKFPYQETRRNYCIFCSALHYTCDEHLSHLKCYIYKERFHELNLMKLLMNTQYIILNVSSIKTSIKTNFMVTRLLVFTLFDHFTESFKYHATVLTLLYGNCPLISKYTFSLNKLLLLSDLICSCIIIFVTLSHFGF